MRRVLRAVVVHLLAWLTRAVLRRYQPTIIAVAGSVGKTTTREAIYTVLRGSYTVGQVYNSLNSEFGVPMVVFGVTDVPASPVGWWRVVAKGVGLLVKRQLYPEILVLEFGEDHPGDLAYLARLAPPFVTVITSIASAHLKEFKSLEGVQNEMRGLVRTIPADGFVVLNADEPLVMALLDETSATVATVGTGEAAEIRMVDAVLELPRPAVDGMQSSTDPRLVATVQLPDHKKITVTAVGFVAPHQVRSFLAALAVGQAFDVSLPTMLDRLASVRPLPGRMRLLSGAKGAWLLDDSYNASPVAMEAAFSVLNKFPGAKRRIAVLGVMNELGSEAAPAHREIGAAAAAVADLVLVVGTPGVDFSDPAGAYAAGAAAGGLDAKAIVSVPNAAAAGEWLREHLKAKDVVLVKGSQVARLEKALIPVLSDPSRAAQLLPRQSAFWQEHDRHR